MINVKEKLKTVKKGMKLEHDKQELLHQWKLVMTHCKIYNQRYDTFDIVDEKQTDYGWNFRLYASWGLTYDKLKTLLPIIEHNMKCHFIYEVLASNECAICDIIYEKQIKVNDVLFIPQKVEPYQLYLGVRITGKPIVVDINKTPFVLIAGATRSGKNGCLNHILISLIHSCTPEQVQIYYFQGAKGDGLMYKQCKHVQAFSMGNFMELLQMAEHLEQELVRRTDMFESMYLSFKGDNLFKYNNLNKHNQLPYIYFVIDEFLVVMPKKSDPKEIQAVKNRILDILEKIAQVGGGLGITYIICHQKPELALCPSFLKNMSLVRVCFGFEDEVCSRIVLGNELAVGLPPRRAYYLVGGKFNMLFTTNLDNQMEKYLRPQYDPKHNTLFSNLEKLKRDYRTDDTSFTPDKPKEKGNGKTEMPKQTVTEIKEDIDEVIDVEFIEDRPKPKKKEFKSQPTTFDMVDPVKIVTEEDKMKVNISNIEGYVPYVPYPDKLVIDKTKIEPSETQKPIKNNKGKVELP